MNPTLKVLIETIEKAEMLDAISKHLDAKDVPDRKYRRKLSTEERVRWLLEQRSRLLDALEMCARFFGQDEWEWGDGTPFDTLKIRTAIRAAKGEK